MKKNRTINIVLILIFVFMFSVASNPVKATEIHNEEVVKLAAKSSTNVIEDPEDSNNYLKTLEVVGYDIYPEFNKNTTQYYVSIPTDVKSMEINAEPEIEGATVKTSGESKLTKTENTVTVTVTSKNKKTKKYTISITKQEDNGLKLQSLEVEGASLSPEFSENRYFYNTEVEQIKIDKVNPLNITAVPNDETAEVEILGNEDLTEGENLITILVKKGEKISTYQINANISTKTMVTSFEEADDVITKTFNKVKERVEELLDTKEKKIAFLVACGVVLFVIIILIIARKHKKHKARKNKENIKKRAR